MLSISRGGSSLTSALNQAARIPVNNLRLLAIKKKDHTDRWFGMVQH